MAKLPWKTELQEAAESAAAEPATAEATGDAVQETADAAVENAGTGGEAAEAASDVPTVFPNAPEYQWGDYFFPVQASDFASQVDFLYWAILWISTFFFVIIVGLMVYFVIKYRRRPGHEKALPSSSHNTPLEIAWSVLPGIILVWMFVTGAKGFFEMRVPPESAEDVWVTAQQYQWTFTYPNGDMTPNIDGLHLVANRPVKFTMESRDVLHSFFIPAFRQKQDVVPGRYTYVWVNPTKPGVYRLYCTEYCGDNHSLMKTNVHVWATEEERNEATEWDWPNKKPEENGERLFNIHCAGCHNLNGERGTGPALNGIYGKEESLLSGTRLVDDNYIRESIYEPNREIVSGFNKPSQMTSFQGKIDDEQMKWLILFLKSKK